MQRTKMNASVFQSSDVIKSNWHCYIWHPLRPLTKRVLQTAIALFSAKTVNKMHNVNNMFGSLVYTAWLFLVQHFDVMSATECSTCWFSTSSLCLLANCETSFKIHSITYCTGVHTCCTNICDFIIADIIVLYCSSTPPVSPLLSQYKHWYGANESSWDETFPLRDSNLGRPCFNVLMTQLWCVAVTMGTAQQYYFVLCSFSHKKKIKHKENFFITVTLEDVCYLQCTEGFITTSVDLEKSQSGPENILCSTLTSHSFFLFKFIIYIGYDKCIDVNLLCYDNVACKPDAM